MIVTRDRSFLFLVTLTYFALSFINITFAASALICMGLPFYLAGRDGRKTWCRSVCPRADLLDKIGYVSLRKPAPKWMVGNKARRAVLGYFCMNVLFITMSTIAVATGRIEPIEKIRLLIVMEVPMHLPQLIRFESLPVWISHLSYRFYSIMLTSSLIGVALALRYKPRTWCAVCPVSSMTGNLLQNVSQKSS